MIRKKGRSGRLLDVRAYIALIDSFIGAQMSARDFEIAYLTLKKSDQRLIGDPVHVILEVLFEDADAYVSDSELRDPEDLDDEQLLTCARRAREALRELGYQ